jgi:UDP-glucose 4-epimerase
MRFLVIGGTGYTGSVLVAKIVEEGFLANILDNMPSKHRSNSNNVE